jgi:hypothetical protein
MSPLSLGSAVRYQKLDVRVERREILEPGSVPEMEYCVTTE